MIRQSLARMGYALLLGACLGVFWDFLRLPARHRRNLADGLFLLGAAWALCVLNFGVCGGDPRLACALGTALPRFLWLLVYFGPDTASVFDIPKKNFQIRKKCVCICRKMGYNRMEEFAKPGRCAQ